MVFLSFLVSSFPISSLLPPSFLPIISLKKVQKYATWTSTFKKPLFQKKLFLPRLLPIPYHRLFFFWKKYPISNEVFYLFKGFFSVTCFWICSQVLDSVYWVQLHWWKCSIVTRYKMIIFFNKTAMTWYGCFIHICF